MGRRPRSASGDEDDSQKGYGAKEMEKVRYAPLPYQMNATGASTILTIYPYRLCRLCTNKTST